MKLHHETAWAVCSHCAVWEAVETFSPLVVSNLLPPVFHSQLPHKSSLVPTMFSKALSIQLTTPQHYF